ncbi:unnamed protein product [Eruca vesicaria subsp. sativa]|uniref:Carotenoid cleavage dioxygenase 1 n=1 Tax=Eruca vesicaria subsp. sativa TaxID=29727 RepID=A0ABC8K866_ERUVS|nr:unnamed protein product [Eruca vesicaria subsp. sativa]
MSIIFFNMLSLSQQSTLRGASIRHTSTLHHRLLLLPTWPHFSITATKHYQNNTYPQNQLSNHRPWAPQHFSPTSRWRCSLLNSVSDQTFMAEKLGDDGILSVNPKPSKGFSSKLIDLLEALVVKFMHDTSLPLNYLSGNFAPLRDETPPECLNGEFLRVGPNPKFDPVAGYLWHMGTMIHGVRIKDSKATYVSRYVKTSRLKQEEFFGAAKLMKIGDLKGIFGLLMANMQHLRTKLKVLDDSYGNGTANTALVYHHGQLLALQETDKPYVIKVLEDGDLQTLGMIDYDKRLTHSFTAHPKVDPDTGEMFTFGYSHMPPYLIYRVVSKDGIMHDPVPITISEPIMMHDFAITENYSIFMDLPMHFRPKEMVKEKKMLYSFDPTKKARFGVLPRYAKDDLMIRWFELPNCFIFHNANAWEEEEEVVLITCRLENPNLDMVSGNEEEVLRTFSNELYEMRFNMKTGSASQKKLSASSVDFPRINDCYTGKKQRYVYGIGTFLDGISKVTGIIKFDLHAEAEKGKTTLQVGGNIQGIYKLGQGIYGSDPIYVPRETAEEDDGYLIFFVHDENTGKSCVNVIDAKTMSSEPVAVVELPHRVPYGFHALFVTEEKLQEQTLI